MSSSEAVGNDAYKRIIVDGVRYYGKHLLLTATGCGGGVLEVAAVASFLNRLARDIDMQPYGEPVAARFGEGDEVGISGVQLIETSAITVHTNDLARELYLDVFSCKGFDEREVLAYVERAFEPSAMTYQVLLRR